MTDAELEAIRERLDREVQWHEGYTALADITALLKEVERLRVEIRMFGDVTVQGGVVIGTPSRYWDGDDEDDW